LKIQTAVGKKATVKINEEKVGTGLVLLAEMEVE
jgi:hypothetical protein